MKSIFLLLATISFLSLSAQDVVVVKNLNDLQKHSALKFKDGVFSAKIGSGTFFSVKNIKIDLTKKYQVSAEFKSSGKKPNVYVGFVPYDANKRQISSIAINDVAKTLTSLAKDAKKGDKVLYLTDCTKWRKNTPHGYIVFNAKSDFSDLPNTTALAIEKNIVKKDNLYVVTLKKPLNKDYAAKTLVRQHVATSAFIYAKFGYVGNQWTKMSGVISGMAKQGAHNKKFWPKTVFIRPLILVNSGDKTSQLEFKNFKLEIVK